MTSEAVLSDTPVLLISVGSQPTSSSRPTAISRSARFTAVDTIPTTISSGPATGSGTVSSRIASTPPGCLTTIVLCDLAEAVKDRWPLHRLLVRGVRERKEVAQVSLRQEEVQAA